MADAGENLAIHTEAESNPVPPDNTRRQVLSWLAIGGISAATSAIVREALAGVNGSNGAGVDESEDIGWGADVDESADRSNSENGGKTEPSPDIPDMCDFEPSRLTSNWIHSFELIHGALDRFHVVFIDQNGNIIDGPIPIENHRFDDESSDTLAHDPSSGRLSQEWLNKWRYALKKKYPDIHLHFTGRTQYPLLYSVARILKENIGADHTVFDIAWKNATGSLVSGTDKNRLEYAASIFAQTNLPAELQRILASGIPAVESMFKDGQTSSANAKGPWQFIESTGRRYGLIYRQEVTSEERYKHYPLRGIPKSRWPRRLRRLYKNWQDYHQFKTRRTSRTQKVDLRNNFAEETKAAAKYFSDIYEKLKSDPSYLKLARRYHLNEEDILYPGVVTSYHSGEDRFARIMKWFLENYTKEEVEKHIGAGPYGMDIFTFMVLRYEAKSGDSSFGKSSKSYFLKVMSMSNLFASRLRDPAYSPSFEEEEEEQGEGEGEECISFARASRESAAGRRVWAPFLADASAIAAGVCAAACAVAAINAISHKPADRRTWLKTVGIGGAGGVLGALAGRIGKSGKRGRLGEIPQEVAASSAKDVKPFDFGTIAYSEKVGDDLLSMDRLIDETANNPAGNLRRRIQESVITPWLLSKRSSLPQYQNIAEVLAAKKAGKLTPLAPYGSMYYRCRNIGPVTDERAVDPRYINVHPYVHAVLKEMTGRLNEELEKIGFPGRKYWVRPIIISAMRPADYNSETFRSSPNSSHTYGVAVDLKKNVFDIVDRDEKQFYSVPDTRGVSRHQLPIHAFKALTRVLEQMEFENKIIVNLESDHLHIVAKAPY